MRYEVEDEDIEAVLRGQVVPLDMQFSPLPPPNLSEDMIPLPQVPLPQVPLTEHEEALWTSKRLRVHANDGLSRLVSGETEMSAQTDLSGAGTPNMLSLNTEMCQQVETSWQASLYSDLVSQHSERDGEIVLSRRQSAQSGASSAKGLRRASFSISAQVTPRSGRSRDEVSGEQRFRSKMSTQSRFSTKQSSTGTRSPCGASPCGASAGKRQISLKSNFDNGAELINNECVQAMASVRISNSDTWLGPDMIASIQRYEFTCPVDWSKGKNKDLLRDLCKLIRSLFWAFQDVEQGKTTSEWLPKGVRLAANRIVQREVFHVAYLLLTIYALFGPDAAWALGHTAQNPEDLTLSTINTLVLLLFVIEGVLHCIALKSYPCSLRFWIDAFASMSILGDTWLGNELVKSDAAVAGRSSRFFRAMRIGGRSTRFVRLLRLARVTQVLRLIPKLQEAFEKSSHDMAVLLWHKRLRHVFQYLDRESTGYLMETELDFFNLAMAMSFPVDKEPAPRRKPRLEWLEQLAARLRSLAPVRPSWTSRGARGGWSAESRECEGDGSYRAVAKDLFRTDIGRRAFNQCLEDINCMKESCAMLEASIHRLIIKVCVIVLMLLVVMQLLEEPSEDVSLSQGLGQLDALAREPEALPGAACAMVLEDYAKASASASLLVLVLNGRLYWSDSCRCEPRCAGAEPELQEGGTLLADKAMEAAGLESHEFAVREVWADPDAQVPRSLAVFDVHRSERAGALVSLAETGLVVILLFLMIVYFATDMQRLSKNTVLHPLWDLMDDMCALKSIEVVGEARNLEDQFYSLVSSRLPGRTRCHCELPVPVADELVQLRKAFDKLRQAMLSWSKFVPVVLLKQLFAAGVEAKIGCSHCEVSVFFCDVEDFQALCVDGRPRAVLRVLQMVLTEVYEALEEYGGTLLEFIGDEVLAIFNAPDTVEDHARRAVLAALKAQERLDTLTGFHVHLRMSVHTAQVLVGNIGSPSRMKYGALGDGINLAARLKSLNSRYGTHLLCSGEALDFTAAHEAFVTRPMGNLVLKGRTMPTKTYEVIGRRAAVQRPVAEAAEKHGRAFKLFQSRDFSEARDLFEEVALALEEELDSDDARAQQTGTSSGEAKPVRDRASRHLLAQCDKFLGEPPPEDWDGCERLKQKAW